MAQIPVEGILGVLCVCLTIYWSAKMSSNAIAAALAALTAAVGRIATEVFETADAIRNHINGDSGISADVLNGLTDRLSAAADALNDVQAAASGASDNIAGTSADESSGGFGSGASDLPPETGVPADFVPIGEPAAPPSVIPDTSGDLPPAGNQNGIGSDFAEGVDGSPEPAPSEDPGSSETPPAAEPGADEAPTE